MAIVKYMSYIIEVYDEIIIIIFILFFFYETLSQIKISHRDLTSPRPEIIFILIYFLSRV